MYNLYNSDCLNVLPNLKDNSVDLIITDPPYELDIHGGKGYTELAQRKLTKDKHLNFISFGFDYDFVFNEFLRVCKIPNFYIFCSNKQISKIMAWFESRKLSTTLLVWNKTNPTPLCNGKHLSDLEFIVYVRGKGATFNNDTPFDYKRKSYISSVVSNKNRLHPTQKPIELLERYIHLSSNENDVILDPFMGSASTGIACLNTNRQFIGIEKSLNYFQLAKQRLSESIDISLDFNLNIM